LDLGLTEGPNRAESAVVMLEPNRRHKIISSLALQYIVDSRVVDPDPDWIRIQRLVWIRIHIGNPDPDPGARKLRNFSGKNSIIFYF
jgi:hypothetical protein